MRSAIIYFVLLAAAFSSCIKEGELEAESKDTHVRLVINNPASRAGETAPGDPIDRLRVYAFNSQGQRVGYLYREGLNTSDALILPMPLDKQQSGSQVYFYVVANDLDTWKDAGGKPMLTENTTRAQLDAMNFPRWQTNSDAPKFAPMSNNDVSAGKGGYSTPVTLTPAPGSKWVNVDVNVQHMLGRVRLMLRKEGAGEIKITRAIVQNGAGGYVMFTPKSVGGLSFAPEAEVEFITDKPVASTTNYELIGQTYLTPNIYGTTDPTGDTYVPIYTGTPSTTQGLAEAHILSIDYTVGGQQKHKDVYLPRVLRNESVDVMGTIKSGSLNLAVTVRSWTDASGLDLNYSTEFSGLLDLTSGNPIVEDKSAGTDAYAVVYDKDNVDKHHNLDFTVDITEPKGGSWTANVTNGNAFEVVKLDDSGNVVEGGATGQIDGKSVKISLRPKVAFEVDKTQETELYFTLINNFGNKGEQIINPNSKHPGTTMRIRVRLISSAQWDELTKLQP